MFQDLVTRKRIAENGVGDSTCGGKTRNGKQRVLRYLPSPCILNGEGGQSKEVRFSVSRAPTWAPPYYVQQACQCRPLTYIFRFLGTSALICSWLPMWARSRAENGVGRLGRRCVIPASGRVNGTLEGGRWTYPIARKRALKCGVSWEDAGQALH